MDPVLDPLTNWRRRAWVCVWLVVAVAVCFAPVAQNGFVDIDDQVYLTENPRVTSGLSPAGFVWAWTTGHAGNWHPLTWLSHQLDWQLFGSRALGHHLVSVGLHALTSCLVFLTLHRLTSLGPLPPPGNAPRPERRPRGEAGAARPSSGSARPTAADILIPDTLWPSALAAALFAVHPLRVESVAWASERKDVLSGFFWWAAIWAFSRYVRRPRHSSRYWLALGLFALGLLAKPMLVTLPCALLLLDYWPFGRWPLPARGQPLDRSTVRFLVVEKLPWFALAVVVAAITVVVQSAEGAVVRAGSVSWGVRLATVAAAYGRYLIQSFVPWPLAFFYPVPQAPEGDWRGLWLAAGWGVLVLAAGCWLAWQWRRSRPWFLVGWCWYVGTLVPVVGFLKVGDQLWADRYTYIPQVGLWIIVAWGLFAWLEARPAWQRVVTLGMALIVAGLGTLTWRQTETWRNTETLARHALDVTRGNYVAHYLLGANAQRARDVAEARRQFREALRFNPGYFFALYDLGTLELASGQVAEAAEHFDAVVRVRPDVYQGYLGQAAVSARRGQLDAADEASRRAAELAPDRAEVLVVRGEVLIARGRRDEGSGCLERARSLDPSLATAPAAIARLRLAEARYTDAAAAAQQALALDPQSGPFHALAGTIFVRRNQFAEALDSYRQALELDRAQGAVANDLAWILATHPEVAFRDGVEALEWAELAVSLAAPNSSAELDTLAAALAELGRFDDAQARAREALARAEAAGNADEARDIRARLELYARRQPYREP